MNDLQIDKALALAIGYAPDRVRDIRGFVQVLNNFSRLDGPMQYQGWQRLDHKDWNVIGPIAKRYGMHVDFARNIAWPASNSVGTSGNSPQQAIALERIKRARK